MGTAPAAGLATIYLNSGDKTLHTINDSGTDIQYAGLGEANTWGAFLQDFSASTIRIPIAAAFTTVTNGGLGYDSTANQLHAAINGVDAIIPTRATAAPTSGNCVKWGSNFQLQDSGALCGGSGTVNAGTAAHLAYYASSGTTASDMGSDFIFSTHTLAGGASAILDLSAAPVTTGLKVPSAAGAAPTVDGQVAMDTTSHHLKVGSNGSTVDLTPLHVITFGVDNGTTVIPAGNIKQYPSVNYTCRITKAMISSDASGSITVDVWKANAAIPTAGNIISASAPVTLSSSQLNQNSALTAWTLTVSPNDVFGFSVASATTVAKFTGELWCQ